MNMKRQLITALSVAALVLPAMAADPKPLTDPNAKLSYSIGMSTASNFKRNKLEIDLEAYMQGIRDALAEGAKTVLTEQEARDTITQWQTEQRAKQEAQRKVAGEKNKGEGVEFLAKNKTKPNVKVTETGLQYEVLTEGTGDMPKLSDTVTVNYRGTLLDGTEFDSSYKRGTPATFPVTGVIKGWTEALQKMKVGSKWRLFIPSELAYGENGAGANIGPNAALTFEVELLSIKQPEAAQPVTSDIIKVPSAEELKKGAKIEIIKPEDVKKLQEQQKKE